MFLSKPLAVAGLTWAACVQALSGKQLRILPLGDSITWGANAELQGGYRQPLLQLLDGNLVNYVGSIEDGQFRDVNHEGWPGYTTDSITPHYSYGGGQANPNVVLIHSGTNNIAYNTTSNVTRAISQMNDLVNTIHFLNPSALIIVAQIGPYKETDGDTQRNARARQTNTGYVSIVQDRQSRGWSVDTIDVYNNLTQADLSPSSGDLVHPIASGYQKIAQLWAGRLDAINTANASVIVTPITKTLGINTGFYTCPSSAPIYWPGPNSLPNLANAQNQFSGISCSQDSGNANRCLCTDPSGPSPSAQANYSKPLGRGCNDMSTTRTQAVQFADVNGDNRADYLYVGPRGQISSWLTTGQKAYQQRFDNAQAANITQQPQGSIFGGSISSVRSGIRLADLNGDGRADVLVVGMGGDVTAWSNNGVYNTSNSQPGPGFSNQGFVFSGTVGSTAYPGSGIQFADLDADGRADLVYIGSNGDITAFPNVDPSNGAFAAFGSPQTIYNGPGFPLGRDSIIVQDMDGDGKADLVVLNRSDGSFKYYSNLGKTSSGSYAGFNSTARLSQSPLTQGDGTNFQFADIGGNSRACLIDIDPNASSIQTRTQQCYAAFV